ncbi:hypothetical protein GH714_029304 [Hevea brasiliensis]|uniref:MULE transposase domain-containing protein n=1 Tax=Hevea brasiliensis TaxID=3981 RepID=A0A6A6LS41_HEVBR|nr:hypothetical protein GH714_029304 [Hevea brasiliensis]
MGYKKGLCPLESDSDVLTMGDHTKVEGEVDVHGLLLEEIVEELNDKFDANSEIIVELIVSRRVPAIPLLFDKDVNWTNVNVDEAEVDVGDAEVRNEGEADVGEPDVGDADLNNAGNIGEHNDDQNGMNEMGGNEYDATESGVSNKEASAKKGEGDLNDKDYDMTIDDDVQAVLEEVNVMLGKDENGNRKHKGRPGGSGERVRTGGLGDTLRFELNDADFDYYDSNELFTESNFDGEGGIRYPQFIHERDMKDPTFKIGMVFSNREEFKATCKEYGIKHNKLNPRDPDNKTTQIKTRKFEHRFGKVFDNFHVTSKWIALAYSETFRTDSEWSINGLIGRAKEDHSFTICRMKAWRAKDLALKQINGDEYEQYGRLHDYKEEILRTNPGSTILFKEDKGVFQEMYVCLTTLKEAFKSGCRNLIRLDGCWLKGTYGGQLLPVVRVDPNDCIFAIAYAIMLAEKKDSWQCFMENLKIDLEMYNSHQWAFMSDR